MIKNEIKIMLITILGWIIFGWLLWTFLWYKLLYQNYISNKWKIIEVKNKIEQNNQRIKEKIETIKKETELTKKEYKKILQNEIYNKSYLVAINVIDNSKIAKKINYWFIYWKFYKSNKISKEIAEFIKNDFIVKYTIKTNNDNLIKFSLNCILKANNLDYWNLLKTYKSKICNNNIEKEYEKKYNYLFNKKYVNVLSTVFLNKRKYDKAISVWTYEPVIQKIIEKYKIK